MPGPGMRFIFLLGKEKWFNMAVGRVGRAMTYSSPTARPADNAGLPNGLTSSSGLMNGIHKLVKEKPAPVVRDDKNNPAQKADGGDENGNEICKGQINV